MRRGLAASGRSAHRFIIIHSTFAVVRMRRVLDFRELEVGINSHSRAGDGDGKWPWRPANFAPLLGQGGIGE